METFEDLAASPGPLFISIGAFDGVHRGHVAVLGELARMAASRGSPSVVITFDPHPQEVLRPASAPKLLSTREERQAGIAACGVDALVVMRFDRELASRSGEEFLRGLFRLRSGARGLVLGHDTRLGHDRGTGIEEVRALAAIEGWELCVVPPLLVGGAPVSSSRIRRLLLAGDMRAAAELLGRPYQFDGVVVTGDGRGRTLGFPTANVVPIGERKLLPRDGIYACRVGHQGRWHPGAMSIGVRPTFGAGPRVVEVHLIGFSGTLVGERLQLQVVERLREERRFDSVPELQEAMARDCRQALDLVGRPQGAGEGVDFVGGGGGPVVGCGLLPNSTTKGGGRLCL